jgi:hypothetical protein
MMRIENNSNRLTEEQLRELAIDYRPNLSEKHAITFTKQTLNTPEVREIADSQLDKALSANGVTIDFLIKEQVNLLEQSKKEKQLSVTYKVIEGLKEDMGIKNKVKVTETRQFQTDSLKSNYETAIQERKKVEISQNIAKQPENGTIKSDIRQD